MYPAPQGSHEEPDFHRLEYFGALDFDQLVPGFSKNREYSALWNDSLEGLEVYEIKNYWNGEPIKNQQKFTSVQFSGAVYLFSRNFMNADSTLFALAGANDTKDKSKRDLVIDICAPFYDDPPAEDVIRLPVTETVQVFLNSWIPWPLEDNDEDYEDDEDMNFVIT